LHNSFLKLIYRLIYILKIIKGVAICISYSQNHNVYSLQTLLISDLIIWDYKELEKHSWYYNFLDEISEEELENLS